MYPLILAVVLMGAVPSKWPRRVIRRWQTCQDNVSCARAQTEIGTFPQKGLLIQIVYFHEPHSGRGIYTAHDRGVVTWWQVCNDRGFPSVGRRIAASANLATWLLVMIPPMIVVASYHWRRSKPQCCHAVPTSDGQWIGNAILSELRANRTDDDPLWLVSTMNPPIITLSPVCTKLRC